jgi:hypothetical protein
VNTFDMNIQCEEAFTDQFYANLVADANYEHEALLVKLEWLFGEAERLIDESPSKPDNDDVIWNRVNDLQTLVDNQLYKIRINR